MVLPFFEDLEVTDLVSAVGSTCAALTGAIAAIVAFLVFLHERVTRRQDEDLREGEQARLVVFGPVEGSELTRIGSTTDWMLATVSVSLRNESERPIRLARVLVHAASDPGAEPYESDWVGIPAAVNAQPGRKPVLIEIEPPLLIHGGTDPRKAIRQELKAEIEFIDINQITWRRTSSVQPPQRVTARTPFRKQVWLTLRGQ